MRSGANILLMSALASLASAAPAAAQYLTVQYSTETLYVLRCAGCHGFDGSGSEAAGVPAFPGFVGAFARDREGRIYMAHVPGVVGSGLSDAEIANVLNYIVATFAGDPPGALEPFTEQEVTELRAEDVADVVGYRRDVARRLTAEGVPVADYPWP
jgi:mono/diheme cytochrome c family protein